MTPKMESRLSEFRDRWEGLNADSYLLGKYLGGSGISAVYSTEYGDARTPAVIKLMPVDRSQRKNPLPPLSELSHPCLIRIFDAGQCEIEGLSLRYVVMERAEANLAEVLPEHTLTEVEAREMLEAVLGALGFLHEQGLAHGSVKPSNILAIGDKVKLSADCITREGSPADDVRSLGATLVQALPRENLPQPFLDIATHCQRSDPQSRWTISQIAARLREPEAPVSKNPRSRMAIYSMSIAIAALAVISIVLMAGRDRSSSAPIVPAQPAAAIPAPVPPQPEAAPAPTPPPHKKSGAWFVVAATYAQQKDAENRVRSMARRWPQFKPEVYSPSLLNQKPYYLVVIGSNLTESAADDLKDRARAAGLAPDAYITHF